jgi:hypothetical protein
MIIVDRRSKEQIKTHCYLVIATDELLSCLSICDKNYYAAWACESLGQANKLAAVISLRYHMKRVRIVHDKREYIKKAYRPNSKYCSYFDLYLASKNIAN